MNKHLYLIFCLAVLHLGANSQTTLTIGQVYDFNINDEFQYCYFNYDNYQHYPNATRSKIIDKHFSVLHDTVFYTIYFNNYRSEYNPSPSPHMDYFTSSGIYTTYYTNLDTLIGAQFRSEQTDTMIGWPRDTEYFEPLICNRLVYRHWGCTNCNYEEGCSSEIEYGQGLGLVQSVYQCPVVPQLDFEEYLFYYKKGSFVCGTYDSTAMEIFEPLVPKINVIIYPNPASESVNIQLLDNSSSKTFVYVSTFTGQVVLIKELQNKTLRLSLQNLDKGMYFITVSNDKGRFSKKLVVR